MENHKQFYGWRVLGVVWLVYFLNMGFGLYGATVLNPAMMKEIPMDRATYGLGFTLLNLFIGLPSLLHAASISRWGIKGTFAIGSLLMVVGSLWLSYVATEPWHYLVGFGVMVGTGLGFGSVIGLSTTVTRWFARFRGRAMAIGFTATGVAGFVIAPLMNSIISAPGASWRTGWLVVAAMVVVSALVALFFVKERPEDFGQLPDGGVAPAQGAERSASLVTKHDWTLGEALRSRTFWLVFAGSCATHFPFWMFTAHWIPVLKGLGHPPATYSFAMGLFILASLFGRLIGGWLMDRMSARYAFALGLSFYLAGSLIAINLTPEALNLAYLAGMLYGFAFGWAFVCLNTTTGNFFGVRSFPRINGVVMMMSAAICSPAAIVAGRLFDVYRSYVPAFELNMVLAVLGICALLFARMPQLRRQNLAVA